MEGTRRGRESARKIFERGARSGQRNAKLHGRGTVRVKAEMREEKKEKGKYD
jgi:hypothetical protein